MLQSIAIFMIGLIGLALMSWGLWLYFPPLAYAVTGLVLMAWSFVMARLVSVKAFIKSRAK